MTTDFDFSSPAVAEETNEFSEENEPYYLENPPRPKPEESSEGPICKSCNKVIEIEAGKRGRKPSYHPECRPSAKKASGTRKRAPKKPAGVPDYREGLDSIFQLAGFGLSMAGEKNEALLADGMAIAEHGPNISVAMDQLAQEKPEIAAVLDRILAVGPYGVLIAAISPLLMQVVSNHGAKIPGVADATSYVKRFVPMETAAA